MHNLFSNCTECNSLLFYSLFCTERCKSLAASMKTSPSFKTFKVASLSSEAASWLFSLSQRFIPIPVRLLPLPSSITLWSATIFPSEHTNIKHTFDLWQPHTAAGTKPNLINNGLFPLKCFINVWLHILTTCFLYNQLTMLDISWTKATLPASPHFFFSKIVFQKQKLPDQ